MRRGTALGRVVGQAEPLGLGRPEGERSPTRLAPDSDSGGLAALSRETPIGLSAPLSADGPVRGGDGMGVCAVWTCWRDCGTASRGWKRRGLGSRLPDCGWTGGREPSFVLRFFPTVPTALAPHLPLHRRLSSCRTIEQKLLAHPLDNLARMVQYASAILDDAGIGGIRRVTGEMP